MLRKEQNDLLTQTGPGTAMGRLFRCNWIPALLAEEASAQRSPRCGSSSCRSACWRSVTARAATG